jgi:hypothetical protein
MTGARRSRLLTRWAFAWTCWALGALPSSPVSAQPTTTTAGTGGERVVVVMEASTKAGEQLRAALAQLSGARISSLTEAIASEATPRVMISVMSGPGNRINVMYWDVSGRIDALSAPADSDESKLTLVASTLASALLTRNLGQLAKHDSRNTEASASCNFDELVSELKTYAERAGQVRRRTFPISVDDF